MRAGGLIASYTAPGGIAPEYAVSFDRGRSKRLLIVPPLFDEMNKMRRLLVGMMRRLDAAGIDSMLIDLPGCNESLAELASQNGHCWQHAANAAAEQLGANYVLGVRGGAMFVPEHLPGWLYAPVAGPNTLNRLARSRTIAAREAGREESVKHLLDQGAREGIDLAGFRLGPQMITDLAQRKLPVRTGLDKIEQDAIGGAGMWLRAEPGDAPDQAEALAELLAKELRE